MPKKTTDQSKSESQSIDWEAKANEYLAGWQRASADLINFRKRSEEDRQLLVKFANVDLILQLLPVLDNFKRAAEHLPNVTNETNTTNWFQGIKAIEKQLEGVLQDNGVSRIEATVGSEFNPELEEAIAHEPSAQPADTIITEVEPGYTLHGKVLKPSKVRVSKGPISNKTN